MKDSIVSCVDPVSILNERFENYNAFSSFPSIFFFFTLGPKPYDY